MYKISEFSKITNLTIKALRYYDEQSILTPSYRNEENSYRYYSEEDFQKAQLVALLRSLDFSISEIRDIIQNCDNSSDLPYYLEEKKSMIRQKIMKEKELIKKIDLYIKPNDTEGVRMNYKVEVRDIGPVTVASFRFKGKYRDVGNYIGRIYKAAKGKIAGAPFNLYYDTEYKEEADIELCVPTTRLISDSSDSSVTARTLPAIKAISTLHKGTYSTLNLAYKTLIDYAAKHNLICLVPSREVYIKGPGMIFKGNENNYITEIIIPVEGKV